MPIRYIDEAAPPLEGRRVLCRLDLNVPLAGTTILNDLRIRAAVPTVRWLMERGAKVLLASHLGRPKRRGSVGTLEGVGERLAELLGQEVHFIDDCSGDGVRRLSSTLKGGQVLLLENVRFHGEEEKNDEGFARALAQNADVYVNDAFACCHRAHTSMVALPRVMAERYAGPLVRRELEALGRVATARQGLAILGGPRLSEKLGLVNVLLGRVQTLCLGGGLAYTFLKAKGVPVGNSLVEEDRLKLAEQILKNAASRGVEILLPTDHVVAQSPRDEKPADVVRDAIPEGTAALDIGPATRTEWSNRLPRQGLVFWSGTLGLTENPAFAAGTRELALGMAACTKDGGYSLVVGEDTAAAVAAAGVERRLSHVCTGGAAAREFLEGRELPALKALEP